MPRLLLPLLGLFLLLAPLPFAGFSHAATADPNLGSAAEISALTAAVNRLAAALEKEQQSERARLSRERLDQAIAYLSFRSRRIETLERDIATAKNFRSNTESVVRTFSDRIHELEERQRQNPKGGSDALTQEIEESKAQRSIFKERQARLDDDILQLENRIYELQNEISKIESFVQRNLEF